MALTGIQIFKLLPKTNCKECGVPTCLAFAMNLASGKAELDSCPYVSDEAKEKLSAQIPMQKLGQPRDVAAAVLFLGSALADYITGQVVTVDGGLVM